MISAPVSVSGHLHRMMAAPPSVRPQVPTTEADPADIRSGHHDRALWSLASHASEEVRAAVTDRVKALQCRP